MSERCSVGNCDQPAAAWAITHALLVVDSRPVPVCLKHADAETLRALDEAIQKETLTKAT